MAIFISHSLQDQPEFENITDALTRASVEYWNPADVKPGSSLRDQLRRAVKDCDVCIFIATRQALASSWCGAELGAFWGAGKPIIVYLAESSLAEDNLPPIVQGDVWERRISRVADRAAELLSISKSAAESQGKERPVSVGNMTSEQLERLIVGAVSLAAAVAKEGADNAAYEKISLAAKGVASSMAEGFKEAQQLPTSTGDNWSKQILWVDDNPANNKYERQALESIGITFTLAQTTAEALDLLSKRRFGAIISDMGRKEGPKEGYVLLDALRSRRDETPFFIYAGSDSPAHNLEAEEHGGQGSTNRPRELLRLVQSALR